MTSKRLQLTFGLQRVKSPQNPSEPGYAEQMARVVRALEDEITSIIRQFEDVTPEIMLEVLRPTYDKTQVYVPKDTKELAESGYLEITSFRGKPRVELGYAKGGKPRYAMYVHEILDYHHAAPTQAKFVERPMHEDLYIIYASLGERFGRFMSG